jgi:hypothetical protein
MSEPKLILKVELLDGKEMVCTLGTGHEGTLAWALHKARIAIDTTMVENEIRAEQNKIQIPVGVLNKLH